MKILTITATYAPSLNGVAISTQRLVASLRNRGHQVGVIKPALAIHDELDDFNLPTLPNPVIPHYPLPIPMRTPHLKNWLSQRSFEVIHVHHPYVIGDFALSLAKELEIPVVFTYHTNYEACLRSYVPGLARILNRVSSAWVDRFCEKCDGVIATSHHYHSLLEKKYSTPVYYASVAGIEKSLRLRENPAVFREKLGFSNHKKILLNVNRHSQEKNLEPLLEMMQYLPSSEFQLVLVGSGPLHNHLIKRATELSVADKIIFSGFVSQEEIGAYYSAADLYVYTTVEETLGITMAEALTAGLPILAADVPNAREFIEQGKTGYLLPLEPKLFAEKAAELLTQSGVMAKLKTQAFQAGQHWLLANTVSQFETCYQSVIEHRRNQALRK